MNLSAAFPPSGVAAAHDLAQTLFSQADKALPGVIAENGQVTITNVVYGSQLIPAIAPAPALGPGMMLPAAAPEAAAAPEGATGAAIESFSGPVSTLTLLFLMTTATPGPWLFLACSFSKFSDVYACSFESIVTLARLVHDSRLDQSCCCLWHQHVPAAASPTTRVVIVDNACMLDTALPQSTQDIDVRTAALIALLHLYYAAIEK